MFDAKDQSNSRGDWLNSLQVAAPCNVSWDSMQGDDRSRHCSQCQKNVYNISAMNTSEANQFLQASSGQACIRFYRRADGNVLLDNCPVGLRKLRAQYRKIAALVTTLISFMQGFLISTSAGEDADKKGNKSWTAPPPVSFRNGSVVMGQEMLPPGAMPATKGHTYKSPQQRQEDMKATASYRNKILPIVYASLPKNENLSNASFYLFINANGSIQKAEIYCHSPSSETDKIILEAVKKLQLPSLPKDIYDLPLCLYYECNSGKPPAAIQFKDEVETIIE